MKEDKFMLINMTALIREFEKLIEWHKDNKHDPYNVDNVAIVILTEIKEAVEKNSKEVV